MDHHIGRLLDAIRELGQEESTIVIFSSDQGLAVGSHGLMGKQNLYDAGMKVPLMIAGPGIRPGQTEALCYLHDVFPTVCDLVGAKVPDGLDGQSQRAVIEGRSEGVRDTLFFAYRDFQRAVRDGRYKLIRYPQVDVTQLFDLHSDPHELLNLAGDSEQIDRIAALTAEMQRWQKDLGDTAPLVVANPQDAAFMPPQD
jgi:arylsulfatase A-like enzyme